MRIPSGFLRAIWGVTLLAGVVLAIGRPAGAQRGGMFQTPEFNGVWNPVVGSGAAYQVETKNGKNEIEILVVGKEDVNGKTGYWLEFGINTPQMGQLYTKSLMVLDGANYTMTRMIIQMPGRGPLEMPIGAARGGQGATGSTDIRGRAEHVGAEDVTTPAGTFSCEHYRDKEAKFGDVWVSSKVTPWGLVKSVNGENTMTLVRIVSNEQDHITGTPQQFDPSSLIPGRSRAN